LHIVDVRLTCLINITYLLTKLFGVFLAAMDLTLQCEVLHSCCWPVTKEKIA